MQAHAAASAFGAIESFVMPLNAQTTLVALGLSLVAGTSALAQTAALDLATNSVIITGKRTKTALENPPSTQVSVTADAITKTINAASVEDTLKYLPSLVVRKRHIGDNFAPIATRTSGLGASARSPIYADGALLSALIANNNGNGSPRWTLVTPEEIERIDVLYGPFSAAYSGNSIGATVNITTRMPSQLEARASALTNLSDFALYGTKQSLRTQQFSGSLGNRFGPLAVLASLTHTDAQSQPISFTTVTGQANPAGTFGGYGDRNKLGQAIRVLGAGGIEHHVQDTARLKLALDINPSLQARYMLAVWRDDTASTVQTYLTNADGAASYRTAANGTTTGFNSGLYQRDAEHFSQALSLNGTGPKLDWQVIGTLYRYGRDWQAGPSPDTTSATMPATGFISTRNDLPGAIGGGAGTIQKQDGTGWHTLDAKASLRLGPDDQHQINGGLHLDQETLNARTFMLANWRGPDGPLGQLRTASHGVTETKAVWAQDEVHLSPSLSLNLGGRYEAWQAHSGLNTTLSSTLNTSLVQPNRRDEFFSPKAALAWQVQPGLSLKLSAGKAYRTPTVGELYQTMTVGSLLANPNPRLRPEQATSIELALEHQTANSDIRLSVFNERVRDALISQINTVTNTTYVQNIDRTEARGMELVASRQALLPRLDMSASLTYADAITAKNRAFPASVGKRLPSVPLWKGTALVTWHATEALSLTAAARFASRNYANLANDDTVGNTYGGFYRYAVFDARAVYQLNDHAQVSVGMDNISNDKYFLFHPFPQRSVFAQINWKL